MSNVRSAGIVFGFVNDRGEFLTVLSTLTYGIEYYKLEVERKESDPSLITLKIGRIRYKNVFSFET